jgi:hypothetical protein
VIAWDAIGRVPSTHHVRRVGGRVLYDDVLYNDATSRSGNRVKLARLGSDEQGIREFAQWVDAETPVELVNAAGAVENGALLP